MSSRHGDSLASMDAIELVACSGARELDSLEKDAREVVGRAALIEVRLDRFAAPEAIDLADVVARAAMPAVATLRSTAEGGECNRDDATRARILAAADRAGFGWIDLEERDAAALPRGKAKRIVSWHGGVETDPGPLVTRLAALDADVVKAAAAVSTASEALRFVSAAVDAGKRVGTPVVAIAMGAAGRWLRPLAGRFGMPLLYAAIHRSRKTAPGQVTVADALDVYGATRVAPKTLVFAVVGADASASLSPLVHNRVFRGLGVDAIYVDVSTPSFEHVAEVFVDLPLAGVSVTAPFKAEAAAFATRVEDDAAATGAANTLVRDGDDVVALNTDLGGFLAGLDFAAADPEGARDVCVGHDFDGLETLDGAKAAVRGKGRVENALVYGNGGVARAIAIGLRRRGVRTFVTGRSQAHVLQMVVGLGAGIEGLTPERATSHKFDLLVKAVPDAGDEELELDPFDFEPDGFAADVVYRPLDSPFLLAARRAGRVPVPGVLMFAEQAVHQAARFCGRDAAEIRPLVVAALRDAFGVGRR